MKSWQRKHHGIRNKKKSIKRCVADGLRRQTIFNLQFQRKKNQVPICWMLCTFTSKFISTYECPNWWYACDKLGIQNIFIETVIRTKRRNAAPDDDEDDAIIFHSNSRKN